MKEFLHPFPVPERPWERVGIDIFSYAGHPYLVLMDAYSNWLEVVLLKDKSSSQVILKLKSIFAKFGCPDLVICDNIPFNSMTMQEFAKDWNFEIVTRSPNYPKSNGLAEKAVGIAKLLLKKRVEEGKDIFDALLQYRNTPLKFINYSPGQLLMSRICKTKVPIADLLKPSLCSEVGNSLQHRSDINKTL